MINLPSIHGFMDAQFDRWRGWLRFGMHFMVAGFIPVGFAGILYASGASENWLIPAQVPAIAGGLIIVAWIEVKDWRKHRNGWRKGIIDFTSKGLGWALGVLCWGGWWV